MQTAERGVEYILFVMAGFRLRALARRRRIVSRVCGRPGFRIAIGDNRLLWKSARVNPPTASRR